MVGIVFFFRMASLLDVFTVNIPVRFGNKTGDEMRCESSLFYKRGDVRCPMLDIDV